MVLISSSLDLNCGPSRATNDGDLPFPSRRGADTMHELRNMLAIIASGAHVLGRNDSTGKLRGVIEAMQHAAQTAGQLVTRLAAETADGGRSASTRCNGSAGRPPLDAQLQVRSRS